MRARMRNQTRIDLSLVDRRRNNGENAARENAARAEAEREEAEREEAERKEEEQ